MVALGDDDNQDTSQGPKKGVDFADLTGSSGGTDPDKPSAATTRSLREAARAMSALKGVVPSSEVQAAIKALDGIGGSEEVRRATAQMDALRSAIGPNEGMIERMRALTGQFGPDSSMGKIAKQLTEQHRSIDALRMPSPSNGIEPPRIPDLHIPPNPIHETNDRLERIEQRFERMLDVAANGATIATGLQAHAAEFLVKFEKAASDNDRSAARAIRLGAIAIVIALAMPLAQILYTELWRVPQDSASMATVITDMQAEIATLRQTQIETAERIASALESSDQQLVEALRDVARSLASQQPELADEPGPTE